MGKKKKIAIVILSVFILVSLLWLIGGLVKNNQQEEDTLYYLNLVEADKKLQTLVERNLQAKGLEVDLIKLEQASTTNIFTPSDFKIVQELNEEIIKQYGKDIGQVLKLYQEPRANEIFLILDALKNTDPRPLEEIKKTKALHDKAVKELLQIPVPKDAQVVHLRLTNSINRLAKNLSEMNKVLDDPNLGLKSSEDYIRNYVLFFSSIEGINIYFSKQGIIFNKNEVADIYDSIGIVGREI